MKVVMKAVEEAAGPTGTIINDVLDFNLKYYGQMPYIVGDKLSFSGLHRSEYFELIEAEVVNMPADCSFDESVHGEYDTKLCVTVRFDAQKYKVNEREQKDVLKKEVTTWLTMNNDKRLIKVLDCEIATTEDADHTLSVSVVCDTIYLDDDFVGELTESVFRKEVWNKHMNGIIKEGVCYSAFSVYLLHCVIP